MNIVSNNSNNSLGKIRCAIYTRKSCEEGLEQEFNSLDAQRMAAESYIASQSGQGWVLIPKYYDDGGFSGGNLERPALQNLFADIQAGKIDCVVVYKIDRLTRSLLDFSKIIEIFDNHNCSFVSVTQSFNTSNSMGKLMLNVLLSFAQYERELTGERIRDKFESSCKKGIWMGGNLPLGYDLRNRKLIINENEAKIIKTLYREFLETGSITETARKLNQLQFTTKNWISTKGKVHKGNKFDVKNVRNILDNPLYMGKIKHKNNIYDGQHEAIITEEVWNQAQNIFKRRDKVILPKSRITSIPLLKGLITCGNCDSKMTPNYTDKKGKKYRYYSCIKQMRDIDSLCQIGSVSANEIEKLITERILEILRKPEIITHTISSLTGQISESDVINYFKNIEKIWDELFPIEQARIINLLVKEVIVSNDGIDLRIFKTGLNSLASEIN